MSRTVGPSPVSSYLVRSDADLSGKPLNRPDRLPLPRQLGLHPLDKPFFCGKSSARRFSTCQYALQSLSTPDNGKRYGVTLTPFSRLLAGSSVLVSWQKQLEVVQQASLVAWRTQTVEKAAARLGESLDLTAAQAPEATLWAWECESRVACRCWRCLPTELILSSKKRDKQLREIKWARRRMASKPRNSRSRHRFRTRLWQP